MKKACSMLTASQEKKIDGQTSSAAMYKACVRCEYKGLLEAHGIMGNSPSR